MSSSSKNWIFVALLMAAIFAVGLFMGKKQGGPETADRQQMTEQPAATGEPEGEPEESTEQEQEGYTTAVSSDGKSSYRVKAGTSSGPPPTDMRDLTPARIGIDWEEEYEARDVLESALVGDQDDAVSVGELIMQCRSTYSSEEQIARAMDRIQKNVQAGNPVPSLLIPGTGETLQFTNFTDFEEISWTRFAQCQATEGMFGSQLRERLAEEARAGSVTARFLYAMWLPTQHEISSQKLIEWITYQSNAWDFTWANIREGEPLGLLAYGRSLEQSGSIYFTPRHLNYGPAFIMAAQKCGMDNPIVNRKVDNMTGYWSERRMTQRLNQSRSLSDEIANMFCR